MLYVGAADLVTHRRGKLFRNRSRLLGHADTITGVSRRAHVAQWNAIEQIVSHFFAAAEAARS